MSKFTSPGNDTFKSIVSKISAILESSSQKNDIVKALKERLNAYLTEAAEIEHLLAMQYLYASFSMKKFPEEFDDYDSANAFEKGGKNLLRLKQIESIRRWEAKILYVSRQEMEHLNLVQNLLAILDCEPFLYRPNYPVSKNENPLGDSINLMPFSKEALEIFRYWEKPDHLNLKSPFNEGAPKGIKKLYSTQVNNGKAFNEENATKLAWEDIFNTVNSIGKTSDAEVDSIEQLYTIIRVYFYFLLKYKLIEGANLNRIVEEHFGFNMTLDSIVEGKYFEYVDAVITQIMEEGEGVWGVPPSLDSHFTVFQEILDEFIELQKEDITFDASLPVPWNPTISKESHYHAFSLPPMGKTHDANSPYYNVTNPVAIEAMDIYNGAYNVLVKMLHGFFKFYSIDYTTGIRPPVPNAFFSTAFYPFMTMVMRPLAEVICRLPADKNYVPIDGKVPPKTAGPNFFLEIAHNSTLDEINVQFQVSNDMNYFMDIFNDLAKRCSALSKECTKMGYHIANYKVEDARDFDVRLSYLAENFERIGQNFQNYWEGKIVAPIPSKNFQNFNNTYN